MMIPSAAAESQGGQQEQAGANDDIEVTVTRTPTNYLRLHFPGVYDFVSTLPLIGWEMDVPENATKV